MKNSLIDLSGKVALVTGAGSGIGEAIAHKLASLGAKVMCAGLPDDTVEEVSRDLRRYKTGSAFYEGDLSDSVTAKACINEVIKEFGRLDILISNAGVVLGNGATEEQTDEIFERTVRSNIFASFYITRAALPALKKSHGCIVATGSVSGLKGEPEDTIYGGTKGFVHSFMQGLAIEQAPHGIRVNVLCPGAIDTAMTSSAHTSFTKKEARKMTETIPMRRKGTVEEMANVVAFLVSDLASYMTGSLITADGGFTLSWGDVEEVPARLRRRPKGALDKFLRHTLAGGFKRNNPEPRTQKDKHH
jgi:NAD(P)-dependent dehydrogenase (short-subunit alcohol dehydrogenase family)